jgi:S1-C subfamily serine protease
VFVLGPPHDADLLADEDPHGGEGFPDDAHGLTFSAAATAPAGAGAARDVVLGGFGTGFLLVREAGASRRAYVVTNRHVVEPGRARFLFRSSHRCGDHCEHNSLEHRRV